MNTTTNEDLTTQVIALLSEELSVEASELKPDTVLLDHADSLEMVSLSAEAEVHFQIDEITDDELESIRTVGDFVKVIEAKKAA